MSTNWQQQSQDTIWPYYNTMYYQDSSHLDPNACAPSHLPSHNYSRAWQTSPSSQTMSPGHYLQQMKNNTSTNQCSTSHQAYTNNTMPGMYYTAPCNNNGVWYSSEIEDGTRPNMLMPSEGPHSMLHYIHYNNTHAPAYYYGNSNGMLNRSNVDPDCNKYMMGDCTNNSSLFHQHVPIMINGRQQGAHTPMNASLLTSIDSESDLDDTTITDANGHNNINTHHQGFHDVSASVQQPYNTHTQVVDQPSLPLIYDSNQGITSKDAKCYDESSLIGAFNPLSYICSIAAPLSVAPDTAVTNNNRSTVSACSSSPSHKKNKAGVKKRKYKNLDVHLAGYSAPGQKLTNKEKNRIRERERREQMTQAIDDCVVYLTPTYSNTIASNGVIDASLLAKKDVLNACSLMLREGDRLRQKSMVSKYNVTKALIEKACINECITILLATE